MPSRMNWKGYELGEFDGYDYYKIDRFAREKLLPIANKKGSRSSPIHLEQPSLPLVLAD